MSRLFSFVCYLLGTPDTRRKGRKTRNALSALTSKPFIFTRSRIVLTTLEYRKIKLRELKSLVFDLIFIFVFSSFIILQYVPNHDNGKIQQIPCTSQISCRMLPETISNYFHYTLSSKNN